MFDYSFSFLQIWGANFGGQPGFAGPAGVRWLMNRSNDVHFGTYWHTLQNLSPVFCLCWGGRGMYTWLLRDCHKRVQGKDTNLPRCHLTWHWNIPNFIGKNDETWKAWGFSAKFHCQRATRWPVRDWSRKSRPKVQVDDPSAGTALCSSSRHVSSYFALFWFILIVGFQGFHRP